MRHEVVKGGEPVGLLALPHIDPTRGRKRLDVAYGMTVGEMVAVALPGVSLDRIRVSIGEHVIDRNIWHRVRPNHGAMVIIRAVPGDDALRSVLQVAVLVAAVALGQFYAPAIAGSIGGASLDAIIYGGASGFASAGVVSTVGSVLTAGFAVAGSLLLNALIPVRGLGDQDKGPDIYAITGLQNSANPGGVVPSILGTHRYAPPFAATTYTEVIGDDQFVIAAFLIGHGPLNLRNHRLGETPIENYSDVYLQLRTGQAGDPPPDLYPQQVFEDQLSVQLKYGEAPSRFTAKDVTECSIDLAFVQGLIRFDDKGEPQYVTVSFLVGYRKLGDADFTHLPVLQVSGNRQKIIRRSVRWTFPERGQYEVHVQRLSTDSDDTKIMDRSDWSAIRSFRPESPFNFSKPVAMAVVRIRASNQLNGTVNNYNCEASLICKDWDASTQTWIGRETSNPASLFRHVLQGPANAYPKTDDQIDLVKLQEWHEFCAAKGLTYNRVHDYNASRLDVLADIAAAGRATPHDDGEKWGVTIDRPQSTYVSAITPRNSWDFQGTTPQAVFPDGFRVQFIDATNGYQQAERIVPFPGVDPNTVEITEDLALPGITDPALIWKEARRRQYELIHRPHTYTVSQDIESLVLARGDLVPLNHDVLDRDHVAARVRSVSGQVVWIDTPVTMEKGRSYAVSIRTLDGVTIRRSVAPVEGETSELNLVGDLTGIAAGDLASFGTAISGPVIDCIVKSVERGDNMTAKLTLIDAAPIIDELVDAETPPPWDGRVGDLTDISTLAPAVPLISVTDSELTFHVTLTPGTGSAAMPASYRVFYRIHGGGAFTTITIPASDGIAHIDGFSVDDVIDVKAHAISAYGVTSADTDTVQATLHTAAPNTPSLDSNTFTLDSADLTLDHF